MKENNIFSRVARKIESGLDRYVNSRPTTKLATGLFVIGLFSAGINLARQDFLSLGLCLDTCVFGSAALYTVSYLRNRAEREK